MKNWQVFKANWRALLFTKDFYELMKKYWFEVCLLELPKSACEDIRVNGSKIIQHAKIWWIKYTLIAFAIFVILAIIVQITKDSDTPNRFALGAFNFFNDWALVLSASVTFLLAVAAFFAILDNRNARILGKRERLLNEIIEWASDITGCNMTVNPESVAQIAGSQMEREYHHAILCDFANRLQAIRGKSLYARSITSTKTFKQYENLNIAVGNLIKKLETYIKSILGCTDVLYRSGGSSDLRKAIDKSSDLRVDLEDSAYKVIEEATTLLC